MNTATTSNDFFGDAARAASPEVDFGVDWYEDDSELPITFPRWRVSWIEKTGELYAVELRPGSSRVEIFGTFESRDLVDAALEGWADVQPTSLAWVRDRVNR